MRLIDLFEKHEQYLKKPCCVVFAADIESSTKEVEDFKNYIVTRKIDILTIQASEPAIREEDMRKYASFFCAGDTNRDVHVLYAKLRPAKKMGKVVVFGNCGRSLIFSKATFHDLGLLIEGMFLLAAETVRHNSEKGSYAEFGVFDGRTISIAWQNMRDVVDNFLCFDSFEGICGESEGEAEMYASGDSEANVATFEHNMKVVGADLTRFKIIEGPFQETLPNPSPLISQERIRIAHIDSDIEEACTLALEYLKDRLVNNAIIMFDEYNAFSGDNNRGGRASVRKFLMRHPEVELELFRSYGIYGASFFFRRKQAL